MSYQNTRSVFIRKVKKLRLDCCKGVYQPGKKYMVLGKIFNSNSSIEIRSPKMTSGSESSDSCTIMNFGRCHQEKALKLCSRKRRSTEVKKIEIATGERLRISVK